MKTKNKKDRLLVYKKLLKLAIEDRKISKRFNMILGGYCYLCDNIGVQLENLPELMKHKPKRIFKTFNPRNGYWFNYDNKNLQRIAVLEQIIENMKGGKHESN